MQYFAEILIAGVLLGGVVLYMRGWLRLRRRGSRLASIYRLLVFLTSSVLVGIVFLSPLNTLNTQYLFMRMLQVVMLCLLAAPAFFISCGYNVAVWGLPKDMRRVVSRHVRRKTRFGRAARNLAPVWLAWGLFIGLFLIWQDAIFANWALAHPLFHMLSLVILGLAALLFWWHIVGTGPRLHKAVAPWMCAVMLVITEIVNMATGVSMAFSSQPLYSHYVAVAATVGSTQRLGVVDDQTLAGATLWVVGSVVYISSIILVINRLFQRHGSDRPEPYPDWDSDERMIMPGLEHRLRR